MRDLYGSTENLTALNQFHASYYDYGDLNIPSRTARDFTRALRILEGMIPQPERNIFDAGCGNGFFLALAKHRGWKPGGCDPSVNNVELSRQKFGLTIDHSGFLEYDPREKKYGAVAFWDVLEHLTDPHAFLRKAADMLNPGGFILVGGPNDKSMLRILATLLYRMSGGHITGPLRKAYLLEHVAYYTLATLKGLFGQHGFKLKGFFMSSTDLEKYQFSDTEKLAASLVLAAGELTGLQNRVIAVFQAAKS